MAKSVSDQQAKIRKDFDNVVNLTPNALENWLKSEESREVGAKESGEPVGHESGRKIIAIKQKKADELTDADYEHMEKVVGYVHRHMAQHGPARDKEHSAWRYSLMNWGHDPLAKGEH